MSLLSSTRTAAMALIAVVLAVGCKKSKTEPAENSNTGTPPGALVGKAPPGVTQPGVTPAGKGEPGGPPTGWSEARDPIGGFRVFVPGSNRPLNMSTAPEWRKKLQMTMISAGTVLDAKVPLVQTYSLVPPAGFKLGSSPDDLYAALLLHEQGVMTFQDALAKETIKLGGRPALRVLAKANNLGAPPKIPDDPEAEQRIAEGYKKDAARRKTYLVTTTATRVIVLMVQSEGDPNPADLKTMIDSFAFL